MRVRVWPCVVVVMLSIAMSAVGQFVWSGGGGDDSWGTGGNWTNGGMPPTNYPNGRVVFTNTDLNSINVLDVNRRITGTAQSLSYGLHYNPHMSGVHTTDLNGVTLVLDGGTLLVGHNTSNATAVIRNGTLQVGETARADVYVGVNSVGSNLLGISTLTMEGTLNATNMGSLSVGRNMYGNGHATRGGTLDVTNVILRGPLGSDTLKLNTGLFVGANSGGPNAPVVGTALFPASLKSLDTAALQVGYERLGYGIVDFGAGSALTNLTCRGSFQMGYRGGYGQLLNVPTGLSFTIGQPGSPADLYLGWADGNGLPTTGTLALVDSQFTGHLRNVYVGYETTGNTPDTTGRLDVSTCEVSAPVANVFSAGFLGIGSRAINNEGGATAIGILRLSPAVTNLDFGTLQFGAEYQGKAVIDIGTNSQLKTVSVTNMLYWGGGFSQRIGYETGTGFVDYLPAGIEIQVGRSNRYVGAMNVSVDTVYSGRGGNMVGNLTITNGTFTGYMTNLLVGINRQYTVCNTRGTINLKQATLGAFKVRGHAYLAYWPSIGNTNGYAYVTLPAGEMNVESNLYIGSTVPQSRGLLDLFGTTVKVGKTLDIQPTGVVTTHVATSSCGLELLSNSTNDLLVATNARLHIAFEADPTNNAANLWGLRMDGNNVAYLQSLTNDGRLSWSTNALSAGPAAKVGVYYDGAAAKTYVGIPGNAVAPTIRNEEPSDVTRTSATLRGYLASTGTAEVTVSVYWGTTDGEAVSSGNWEQTNTFMLGEWIEGDYPEQPVSLSASNIFYYYRFAAAGPDGSAAATSSTHFTAGDVIIEATDSAASEIGLDPGVYTVTRAGATDQETVVRYTVGGTASNTLDYTLSPTGRVVTIPAGASTAQIALTPIENPAPELSENAILSLAPGPHAIGAPSTATVDIADAGASTNTSTTDVGPWTGLGLDDLWGNAGNWLSNASPALVYTGKLVFTTADLGNLNVVETNRVVTGASGSTNHGLVFNINAADTNSRHTTDLDGNALTLNGGALQVGNDAGNSLVSIGNGVLVLGDVNRPDVHVGSYASGTEARTGNVLTVTGTVDTRNAGGLSAGRSVAGSYLRAEGIVDMSAATLVSGDTTNAMVLRGDLRIAQNINYVSGMTGTLGRVVLPASLRSLSVSNLYVGYIGSSTGILDFGAGSTLTNLDVAGSLYLGTYSAQGQIENLPTGVTMTVGRPSSPATMMMGQYAADPYGDINTIVRFGLTNGVFRAHLASLTVGEHSGGNPGTTDARLDLSQSSVQIGSEPDMVQIGALNVGAKGGLGASGYASCKGVLRLPPSVTNITAGTLSIATRHNSLGILDIGSASQLKALVVTNALHLGARGFIGYESGGSAVDYLPAGIDVKLGTAAKPVDAYIGYRAPGQYPAYGDGLYAPGNGRIVVTNGTFSGYFASLYVGSKEDSPTVMTGVLDVAQAGVSAFSVAGHALIGTSIGTLYVGGESGNRNGNGYLYLPAIHATIASNLYVGDSSVPGRGWVELFGTTLSVSGTVEVGESGVITTHVYGVSCGLDIASASPGDFTISTNGRVHLAFKDGVSKTWGLRMAGDQAAYLQGLHSAGKLTWTLPKGDDAQIYVAGTHTVVRVPPAKGSVFWVY